MFTYKIFELYSYQKEIHQQGKNKQFSILANRLLGGEASKVLDGLFYVISTKSVINPEHLEKFLHYDKNNTSLIHVKETIDDLLIMAHNILIETN